MKQESIEFDTDNSSAHLSLMFIAGMSLRTHKSDTVSPATRLQYNLNTSAITGLPFPIQELYFMEPQLKLMTPYHVQHILNTLFAFPLESEAVVTLVMSHTY